MKHDPYRPLRAAGVLGGLGFLLVATTMFGYWVGHWLDRRWGTDPWLSVVGLLFGVAAGFMEMIRLISRYSNDK